MRYNPATDRARSIDEIAAQCHKAINQPITHKPIDWGMMEQLGRTRWNQYGAGTQFATRTNIESCANWHAATVAEAMGNRAGARLITRMEVQRLAS